MKLKILVVSLLVFLSPAINASDDVIFDANIIRTNGAPIDCRGFSWPKEIDVKVENVRTKIESSNIEKIVVLKKGYWNDGKSSHRIEEAAVTFKDRRNFIVKFYGTRFLQYVKCNRVDPISGRLVENTTVISEPNTQIVFNSDFGSVREDERGNIFPNNYLYSPFTGKELKLKQAP